MRKKTKSKKTHTSGRNRAGRSSSVASSDSWALMRILLRQRWSFLFCVLLTCLGALYVGILRTPLYRSTAQDRCHPAPTVYWTRRIGTFGCIDGTFGRHGTFASGPGQNR